MPALASAFADLLLASISQQRILSRQSRQNFRRLLASGSSVIFVSHTHIMARAFATLCIATVLLASGSCHARSLPWASEGDDHTLLRCGPTVAAAPQIDHAPPAGKLSEHPAALSWL
jgi:hypothetical protein